MRLEIIAQRYWKLSRYVRALPVEQREVYVRQVIIPQRDMAHDVNERRLLDRLCA